jgi:hypothetical protein
MPRTYGLGYDRRPEDPTKCIESVWHQCSKKRVTGPNGEYCKQHDPERVKACDAERDAKREAEWMYRKKQDECRRVGRWLSEREPERFAEILKEVAK